LTFKDDGNIMKIKKKPLEPVAVPEVKEHKPIFDRDNEVAECHRR